MRFLKNYRFKGLKNRGSKFKAHALEKARGIYHNTHKVVKKFPRYEKKCLAELQKRVGARTSLYCEKLMGKRPGAAGVPQEV